MARQVLLLRGINVGGRNTLPMKDLTGLLTKLGATDIQTYIQSGNAVFTGALEPATLSDAIEASKGFRPLVHILSAEDFRTIAAANPYPESEPEGKTLHIWFLTTPAEFDTDKAQKLAIASERFHVSTQAIYLHAPDGIGRSKLAGKLEKLAGVPITARNWNTIAKLLEMVEA